MPTKNWAFDVLAGTWSQTQNTPYAANNPVVAIIDDVKRKILEDHEYRKALWAKLQFSLDGEPDPWFDFQDAQVDTRQFAPVNA